MRVRSLIVYCMNCMVHLAQFIVDRMRYGWEQGRRYSSRAENLLRTMEMSLNAALFLAASSCLEALFLVKIVHTISNQTTGIAAVTRGVKNCLSWPRNCGKKVWSHLFTRTLAMKSKVTLWFLCLLFDCFPLHSEHKKQIAMAVLFMSFIIYFFFLIWELWGKKESSGRRSSLIASVLVSGLSSGLWLSKLEQPPLYPAQRDLWPGTLDVTGIYLDKCRCVWMLDFVCAASEYVKYSHLEPLLRSRDDASSCVFVTLAHKHKWSLWYGIDSFCMLPFASCNFMHSHFPGSSMESLLHNLDDLPDQYRGDGFWRYICVAIRDPLVRIHHVCGDGRLQLCPSLSAHPESRAPSSGQQCRDSLCGGIWDLRILRQNVEKKDNEKPNLTLHMETIFRVVRPRLFWGSCVMQWLNSMQIFVWRSTQRLWLPCF